MRIIIAGCRNGADETVFNCVCDMVHDTFGISEVVSGAARGVDTQGEQWAEENDILVKRFPANWTEHGRGAGRIRNAEMADYVKHARPYMGHGLIAFPSKGSVGTIDMIQRALTTRLDLLVVERI